MTRDSWIWKVLFYGGGILWALIEALVALSPSDAALIGITPEMMSRIRVISILVVGAGGKFGLSFLKKKEDGQTVDLKKVGPVVLLLLTLPLMTACAMSTKAKLQQADRGLVGALKVLDSVEQQMFTEGSVTPDFHKRFSGYMYTALTAGETFHKSVMAYKPGQQPLPMDVVMLTSAMRSAADLVRSLPASDKRDKIAAAIDTVALVANQILLILLPPAQADAIMPSHLVYAGGH